MADYPPVEAKVWGPYACFTRPELKAERVSYPVMTPSAARGVLEAIFWKPEFSWQIREIHVLREIQHFSIVRNEIKRKIKISTAQRRAEIGNGYVADQDRTQRHTLALRDVAYLVKADVMLSAHGTDSVAKYRDQFRRRVSRGNCYHRPYLGCREFAAFFGPADGSEHPIKSSGDLGLMLFDMEYPADGSGRGVPKFFVAALDRGRLIIPARLYSRRNGPDATESVGDF